MHVTIVQGTDSNIWIIETILSQLNEGMYITKNVYVSFFAARFLILAKKDFHTKLTILMLLFLNVYTWDTLWAEEELKGEFFNSQTTYLTSVEDIWQCIANSFARNMAPAVPFLLYYLLLMKAV